MIKNAIVVCDYGYVEGGAARIAHDTAIAMRESGVNVVFFCAVGPVSEELKSAGFEVICLEQSDILHEKNRLKAILRGINNKVAKRKFKELLCRFDPRDTVIHVHTWTKAISSSIFAVAKRKGFQIAITVHDYFLVCPNGGLFNYKKREICELKPMSVKCIACNCDARSYPQKLFRVIRQKRQNRNIRKNKNISYIFISEFSKREFLKRYHAVPQEKQYFLPNMVNFPADRTRIECEKNDAFLFIGGITEVKGIRLFCQAVSKANVKAVVIGEGILKDELEKEYPNIEFVGWKSQEGMWPYLQQARCLIFPSIWYEGLPLVPLEVLAHGVPVICSDLNAASDYIENQKTGIIYRGSDLISMTDAIKNTFDDDVVLRLSQNVYQTFDDKLYSSLTYSKNLIDIYNKILSQISHEEA